MKSTLILIGILLFLFPSAYADIYKYTDEHGVVCYTDAPLGKKADRIIKEKTVSPTPQQKAVRKDSQGTSDYHSIIHEKATKYSLDPSLVKAVIKAESNWNERAVSRKGAMGLMQLMPTTANEMDVRNPFNPEENIEGGTRYLRYLLERYNGDLTLALAAYNAGPKRIDTYGSIPPITETRQYVNRVLSLYNGRLSYAFDGETPKQKRPEPIYKVVLQDGTVLFTNSPLFKTNISRF